MEQYNRRTTPVFTTNWYLYKTHLHPITIKPQEQNTTTKTNNYWKKRKNSNTTKTNNHQNTTNFEELLLSAIDEGLNLIGESAKKDVYNYLEHTLKMNRPEIPQRIEEFTKAIECLFGNGAKILEIQMMKNLFNKSGCTVKQQSGQTNLTFIEYITTIKKQQNNNTNPKKPQPN